MFVCMLCLRGNSANICLTVYVWKERIANANASAQSSPNKDTTKDLDTPQVGHLCITIQCSYNGYKWMLVGSLYSEPEGNTTSVWWLSLVSVCALAKCKAELAVAKTPATPNLNPLLRVKIYHTCCALVFLVCTLLSICLSMLFYYYKTTSYTYHLGKTDYSPRTYLAYTV